MLKRMLSEQLSPWETYNYLHIRVVAVLVGRIRSSIENFTDFGMCLFRSAWSWPVSLMFGAIVRLGTLCHFVDSTRVSCKRFRAHMHTPAHVPVHMHTHTAHLHPHVHVYLLISPHEILTVCLHAWNKLPTLRCYILKNAGLQESEPLFLTK